MWLIFLALSQAPPDPTPEYPHPAEADDYGYTFAFAEEQRVRHYRHVGWLEQAPKWYGGISERQWAAWHFRAIEQRYAWTLLSEALNPEMLVQCRRERLMRLRHLLGPSRRMPPPYPLLMYPAFPD